MRTTSRIDPSSSLSSSSTAYPFSSQAEFETAVNQKYQYHNVKMACEEKGYAVEEELNEEDGSIRLVVRKWVSE